MTGIKRWRPPRASELGGVAVAVAVGCDTLVDLPHAHLAPGQIARPERAEHRRRARSARDGERRRPVAGDRGPQSPGDRPAHTRSPVPRRRVSRDRAGTPGTLRRRSIGCTGTNPPSRRLYEPVTDTLSAPTTAIDPDPRRALRHRVLLRPRLPVRLADVGVDPPGRSRCATSRSAGASSRCSSSTSDKDLPGADGRGPARAACGTTASAPPPATGSATTPSAALYRGLRRALLVRSMPTASFEDRTRDRRPADRPGRDPRPRSACRPTSLAAADDEAWDAVIRAESDEAFRRTGPDVGTPIITYDPPPGNSLFGPVISSMPDDDETVAGVLRRAARVRRLPGVLRAQAHRPRPARPPPPALTPRPCTGPGHPWPQPVQTCGWTSASPARASRGAPA